MSHSSSPSITPIYCSIRLLPSRLRENVCSPRGWQVEHRKLKRVEHCRPVAYTNVVICHREKVASCSFWRPIEWRWPGRVHEEAARGSVMNVPAAMPELWKGNSLSLLTYPRLPYSHPLFWPRSFFKPPPWLIQRLMEHGECRNEQRLTGASRIIQTLILPGLSKKKRNLSAFSPKKDTSCPGGLQHFTSHMLYPT